MRVFVKNLDLNVNILGLDYSACQSHLVELVLREARINLKCVYL